MNREQKLLAVAQCALLHDVGKLFQRADEHGRYLNGTSAEASESTACPLARDGSGRYTHKHVLWTIAFHERHKDNLPLNPTSNEWQFSDDPQDNLTNAAAFHHLKWPGDKMTPWQRIVQIADRCASGMDRTDRKQDADGEMETRDWAKFRRTPLITPWSSTLNGKISGKGKTTFKIQVLDPADDGAFPVPFSDSALLSWNALADNLDRRMITIGAGRLDPHLKLEAVVSALELTTWCVPSSAMDVPDISLFDHLRATAAIAVCLAAYAMTSDSQLDEEKLRSDQHAFRFFVVDLAGIQSYIYDMDKSGFKGMAKVLRGRSFFVNAMLEGVEIALLKRLGLPRVMKLMDGGGKAILLLPNLPNLDQLVADFTGTFERALLRETHGRLRVITGLGAAFSQEVFRGEQVMELKKAFDSAFSDLETRKHRAFASVLSEPLSFVVDSEYHRGPCSACNKLPATHIEDEGEEAYCHSCEDCRLLGEQLTHAKYLKYLDASKTSNGVPLPGTGVNVLITGEMGMMKDVLSLSYFGSEKDKHECAKRYIANYVPRWTAETISDLEREQLAKLGRDSFPRENEIKSFEEIARSAATEEGGVPLLAAYKADVDSLGSLFASVKDIGGGKGMLARMMGMSRLLTFFFSGVLEHDLEKNHRNIYTVYAGGDDLFYIGSWREVLAEAANWRKRFAEFTAHHPAITLSGGITLAHPGMPVHRMRDEAERELEEAKHFVERGATEATKNRIGIWGYRLLWENWERDVVEVRKRISRWFQEGKLTTGMAYRLLQYARDAERTRDKKKMENDLRPFLWRSHMRYDLGRNLRGKDGQIKKGCEEMYNELYAFTALENTDAKQRVFQTTFSIALTWALYLHRGARKKEEAEA